MPSPKPLRLAVQPLEDRATPATLVGLTTDNRLWTFDSGNPTTILTSVKVSGLAGGEDLLALDARPATGQLYAPTNQGRLYTLNPTTGVATAVSPTPFVLPPKGAPFGFDFNPTVDRIRLVASGTGEQNLRLNPNDGTVADGDGATPGVQPDTPLAFGATDPNTGRNPTVVAAAYTNNFLGATTTTLYALDSGRDVLVTIGGPNGAPSPNGGQLTTVGALGTNIGSTANFDIAPDGTAYAAVRTGNGSAPTRLATVNLTTGALTLGGQVGPGRSLDGLAVLPREEIAYGLTAGNRLVSFRVDDPGRLLTNSPLSGLTGGETVLGMDVRPATGELFALTDTNRVLRLNPATGQGVQVGAAIDPAVFTAALAGGFDFNPTVDRLRLVNVIDDNLRYNPVTFAPVDGDGVTPGVQGDTDLAFIATDTNFGDDPRVVAAAYDRNDNDSTTATTLFLIDADQNILIRQGAVDGNAADVAGGGSPNGGLLTTIGALGVDPDDAVSFDVAGAGAGGNGAALAVMQLQGEATSALFAINLTTGAATRVGAVAGGEVVRAFAVAPPRIGFAVPTVSVSEKGGNAVIVITRTGGAYGPATVRFSAAAGSATAGADFTAVPDLDVVFAAGETRKVVLVPILQDRTREPNETVLLSLTALSGGGNAVLDNPSGLLTIIDDDGGASTGI